MQSKRERKIEREILWVLGLLAAIIVVYLVASSLFSSFNSFTYNGLHFTKERLDSIQLFHYNYFFKGADNKVYKYNLYLRHDPRTNDVPISGDKIKFTKPYTSYISVDSDGLQECQYSAIAIGGLAGFLRDNQIPVQGALRDFQQANAQQKDWITCDNKPANPVIEIFSGNKTQITIDKNCYRIEVANCEILQAVEKFQIQTILDA